MKRFFTQKTISIFLIVIGLILIIFAKHSMNKVDEAKGTIKEVGSFFTNSNGMWNPVINFFGGKAYDEASKYDLILLVLFIAGIILVLTGIFRLFWYRKT